MDNEYLARKLVIETVRPLVHDIEKKLLEADLGIGYVGNLHITALYDDLREMKNNIIKTIIMFDSIDIIDQESLVQAELCYISISYASKKIELTKLKLEKELGAEK